MTNMQGVSLVSRTSGGEVVARRFGEETLLVPVCGGVGDLDSVYTLNAVGTAIWNAIAQPVALDSLVASVADEFDVTPEQARLDVGAFLGDLAQLGLVRTIESAA